jgi:epoxide hydrolase 4
MAMDPSSDPSSETAPAAPSTGKESGSIRTTVRFSHRRSNGITLHVAEAGPEDGPAVILLHGFPEFWYGWRHQIDALAAAGYRVLAPDQRGYNLSGRPKPIAAYDLDQLARDVVGLADGLGLTTFSLVGHDWGAAVGFWLASRHPPRLDRFVALAAPHPCVWVDAMRNDPVQKKKSGYAKIFRLPWLPEVLLRHGNFTAFVAALEDSARPAGCSPADLALYRVAWSMPGALTGMVNWYRALFAKKLVLGDAGRIKVPCLIIWGRNDKFGRPELAERSAALCDDAHVVHLDTSHWVQHDAPERVNELLIAFLDRPGLERPGAASL